MAISSGRVSSISEHPTIVDAYGALGMPVTAFYDAQGKLVDRSLSALTEAALPARLATLFGINAANS